MSGAAEGAERALGKDTVTHYFAISDEEIARGSACALALLKSLSWSRIVHASLERAPAAAQWQRLRGFGVRWLSMWALGALRYADADRRLSHCAAAGSHSRPLLGPLVWRRQHLRRVRAPPARRLRRRYASRSVALAHFAESFPARHQAIRCAGGRTSWGEAAYQCLYAK